MEGRALQKEETACERLALSLTEKKPERLQSVCGRVGRGGGVSGDEGREAGWGKITHGSVAVLRIGVFILKAVMLPRSFIVPFSVL